MSTIKPVTPRELESGIVHASPPFVIEAVNQLITARHSNGRAEFTQKELVATIQKLHNVSSEEIYKSGWLNFEAHYRAAGWNVVYDRPGYNESYDARFVFTVKVMS